MQTGSRKIRHYAGVALAVLLVSCGPVAGTPAGDGNQADANASPAEPGSNARPANKWSQKLFDMDGPARRTALKGMAPVIKTNKWRIFDYAESQDRLFMEGVDEFWLTGGEHVAIPYAGVLEFRGLKIHAWREYFDGRISAAMKAGAPITAEVEEMISRPVAR